MFRWTDFSFLPFCPPKPLFRWTDLFSSVNSGRKLCYVILLKMRMMERSYFPAELRITSFKFGMCAEEGKAGCESRRGGFLPAALRGALWKALLASPRKTSTHSATPSPETHLIRDKHAEKHPPSPKTHLFRDRRAKNRHLSPQNMDFRDRRAEKHHPSPRSMDSRDRRRFFYHLSRKPWFSRDRHLFITRLSPNSRLPRDERWLYSIRACYFEVIFQFECRRRPNVWTVSSKKGHFCG